MPKIIVVDDEEKRADSLKNELKKPAKADSQTDDSQTNKSQTNKSQTGPYCVKHVTHWATPGCPDDPKSLKALFEGDAFSSDRHETIDLIVLDVDFSKLDSTKLIQRTGNCENDKRYQGWYILEQIRQWEKEENRHPCRVMMVSSRVPDMLQSLEDYIWTYRPETYLFQVNGVTDPTLVSKIQTLCPAINDQKIAEWRDTFGIVCGKSRGMYELMHYAERIAQSDCNIWIDGDTGVGKELMAQFIHRKSPRATDCGALLINLVTELAQLRELGADIYGTSTDFLERVELELTRTVPGFRFPTSRLRESVKEITDAEQWERLAELEIGTYEEVQIAIEIREKEVEKHADRLRKALGEYVIGSALEEAWKAYTAQVEESFPRADRQRGFVHLVCRKVLERWGRDPELFGFRAFNCAELSTEPNALLAKLFGVPAGAFTGVSMRPGIVKATSYVHGTLFLDEIGDLKDNPQAQEALLRVLQEGELVRAQASTVEKVNVRIIGATNKDIRHLVETDQFRHDLYTRIVQAYIRIPKLTERREDMAELVNWLFEQKIKSDRRYNGMEFDCVARSYLTTDKSYSWHGNIRDLKNVIDHAVEVAYAEEDHKIRLDHLARTLDRLKEIEPPDRSTLEATRQANMTFLDEMEQLLDRQPQSTQELRQQMEDLLIKRAVREFVKRDGQRKSKNALFEHLAGHLGRSAATLRHRDGNWYHRIDRIYQQVLQEATSL